MNQTGENSEDLYNFWPIFGPFAILLKLHFGTEVLLYMDCTVSEQVFVKRRLEYFLYIFDI